MMFKIDITTTKKQKEALNNLLDLTHTEILFGGGAGGCFDGEILIKTSKGYKKIKDIEKNDFVLSFNEINKKLVYSKVLNKFNNGCGKLCISVKLKNGNEIKATADHKFLFNGKWIEIGKLARRAVEANKRLKRHLFYKQQGQIKNTKLEKFRQRSNNEPFCKQKGLLENYNCNTREKKEYFYPPDSCRSFFRQSQAINSDKSQRLQQKKQFYRKSRMGICKRKLSTLGKIQKTRCFFKKYWQSEKFKTFEGARNRNKYINRKTGFRNTRKIYSTGLYKKNIVNRIWSFRSNYKRYYFKKELETSQIKLENIKSFRFFYNKTPVYDLEIENTHTYTVTKDNIIVHNSKSYLGCLWLLVSCIRYPATRWLMGRATLKSLKESTLNTFFYVISKYNLKEIIKYNQQSGVITFINNSEIYLKDLAYYPSDPNYDSLGSTEFTGAFIDECNQIEHKCKEVVSSRLRYKLSDYNLIPKLLMTCNPAKNWVYTEFYKPYRDNNLPDYRAFIPALVTDNPYISPHYIENLKKIKDIATRERLLNGNWEYDDDPAKLFDYTDIVDLFSNFIESNSNIYITADIARKGKDKTVICVWKGLEVLEIKSYDYTLITDTVKLIEQAREKYKIPISRVLADEDGLGGGVVDILRCRGFVGGSSCIQERQGNVYRNLRAQCYFKLSEYVKQKKIKISEQNLKIKENIIEELSQIKDKNRDSDGKLAIISKDEIKDSLGRSPDFADVLMMRMLFELDLRTPRLTII